MDFKYTYQKEAQDRNTLLVENHGKIPSYALWREEDIEKESIDSRYNWWNNEKVKNGSVIVINWKYYLSSLKKTIKKDEYCSKRMGDELSCDI